MIIYNCYILLYIIMIIHIIYYICNIYAGPFTSYILYMIGFWWTPWIGSQEASYTNLSKAFLRNLSDAKVSADYTKPIIRNDTVIIKVLIARRKSHWAVRRCCRCCCVETPYNGWHGRGDVQTIRRHRWRYRWKGTSDASQRSI